MITLKTSRPSPALSGYALGQRLLRRGFYFACQLWYAVHWSLWSGKLRAIRPTLRILSAWPHRSDKKAASTPAVRCVGRARCESQDVAYSPRRLSGRGWLPADRQENSPAPYVRHRQNNNTGQRLPSTRWAMRRKPIAVIVWATQTNDLSFGLTERGFVAARDSDRQQTRTARPARGGGRGLMARHGGGLRLLRSAWFFRRVLDVLSFFVSEVPA